MKSTFVDVSKIKREMSLEEITNITMNNISNLAAAYPDDIPNDLCNVAILSGILYQSERSLKKGYFERLLSTQFEDVYIWKAENGSAHFACKVSGEVKGLEIWKTFGALISLSYTWSKGFEHAPDDVAYNWVYRFEPNQTIADLDFYDNHSIYEVTNGVCVSNHEMTTIIRLMSLLNNDDIILNSIMNFNSSMQLCYTCLFCELSSRSYKMHPSHEPQVWEKFTLHNNFETAIVLACKSVENLLGKPPKRNNINSVNRFKLKWSSILRIDPDEQFEKAKCSYFDFYYQLFNLRNDSAHANYKNSFDLERKKTIESQCFAAIIILNYIDTNLPSFEDSSELFSLNREIVQ